MNKGSEHAQIKMVRSIALLFIGSILLCLPGIAQTQGGAPFPKDAYASGTQMNGGTGACAGIAGCVNLVEGVANNDLIVCAASQEHVPGPGSGCATGSPAGNDPPWTFADTASFTWHMQTATNISSTAAQLQAGYACATSTQSTYRVSWTGYGSVCQSSFQCTRFKNTCSGGTATVDAINSAVSSAGSGVTSTSTTLTTTAVNDLVVSYAAHSNATGGGTPVVVNGTANLGMAVDDTGMYDLMAWMIAPALGSNTQTLAGYGGSAGQQIVMQSLAFKLPIALSDSALPQAASGAAYSAQLHCQGAIVSNPTYSVFSGTLPTGITLNTSTGVLSASNVTGTTQTVGFRCTDGTNTSSTDSLTITVGAGFNSITVVNSSQGNFSLIPGSVTFAVQCGDIISIRAMADDTHNGQGYLQPINGLSGFVSDTFGSSIQTFQANGGVNIAPLVDWVIGPVQTSGADTITVTNGTASSSGLHYYAEVIRGSQGVLDPNVSNSVAVTANGTIAASYTTVVPNEYLEIATATGNGGQTGDAITYSAPFVLDSVQQTPGMMGAGHLFVSSASTVTATSNITEFSGGCVGGANFCDSWATLITAFRPGVPGACQFTGAGEKKRRQAL